MSDAIEFDRDLYHGAAGDYDQFRAPFPRALLDDLLAWTRPSGQGRVLDLACGTGQIAFAIAHRFAEVWAVDQEPDMIAVVSDKARAGEARHIRGIVSRAEDLAAPASGFELVAIGNAFHRLPREAIAERVFGWLAPAGSIALLWATSPWAGDEAWQRALAAVLESWKVRVRAQDRVPAGWNQAREERPDVAVLREAGFEVVRSAAFRRSTNGQPRR